MIRSISVNLKHITSKKQRALAALLQSYRAAVNFYIRSLWDDKGKLDKATKDRLNGSRLSARYTGTALRKALSIVISTRKALKVTKKYGQVPVYTGAASLCNMFVEIEKGEKSFDYVLRLSTLKSRTKTIIPFNSHRQLNKWLDKSGAKLLDTVQLYENKLVLQVEIPDVVIRFGDSTLGLDIGVNKLLSTSKDEHFGLDFKQVRDKILRRRRGSKSYQRALRERDNLIGRTVNQLSWDTFATLGVEDLVNLKRGRPTNRTRAFRKALAPWTYRQVLNRIKEKAEENRVRLIAVPPANTSRTCPVCGEVDKENRKGEDFRCVRCGYTADADFVGAQNVLARTLQIVGSLQPPSLNLC